MPATRPATVRTEDLPDIMTPQELADYERSDVRIVRKALERGDVAGAWRRGRHWKICREAYLASIGGRHAHECHDSR